MSMVALPFGILFIGTGFVRLVWKLHDRSMHESLTLLTAARSRAGQAVAEFANVLMPIMLSISVGLALVIVGLLGR
jgi:hypothetical protein